MKNLLVLVIPGIYTGACNRFFPCIHYIQNTEVVNELDKQCIMHWKPC